MEITVSIPDEIASQVCGDVDPPRVALQAMAVEAYRTHHLTAIQLRRLLDISSRDELDAFLKERGVWLEYSLEDFRREGEITSSLSAERDRGR